MKRRAAFKSILIGIVLSASVYLTGCAFSVKSLAGDFLASAEAIYAVDPIPELETAITALKTAIAGYNGSSTNCLLISSANTVASILDEIDPNSAVAEVAAIAIAGFDALLANLAPCNTPASAMPHKSRIRGTAAYNSALSKLKHPMFPSHAFKSQFNPAAEKAGVGQIK
jgi:hypothetical protein